MMANRLQALAYHLGMHPHLEEPYMITERATVLQFPRIAGPTNLWEWAKTVGLPACEVRWVGDYEAHLHVFGSIDVWQFDLWCADWHSGDLWKLGTGPMTLNQLECYARDRTVK